MAFACPNPDSCLLALSGQPRPANHPGSDSMPTYLQAFRRAVLFVVLAAALATIAVAQAPITQFKVTVGPDVPLGCHDCRLVGKWGVSNPRVFAVGDLAEVQEKEPNNDVEVAQKVELNSTINGNMAGPADVDYYVFAGK